MSQYFEEMKKLLLDVGICLYDENGNMITLFELLNRLMFSDMPKELLDDILFRLNEIIMTRSNK